MTGSLGKEKCDPSKACPYRLSITTRSERVWLHTTPSQLQKWMVLFHELNTPFGSLMIAFLKLRREMKSVSLPLRVVQLMVPAPHENSNISMAHGMSMANFMCCLAATGTVFVINYIKKNINILHTHKLGSVLHEEKLR